MRIVINYLINAAVTGQDNKHVMIKHGSNFV